MLEVMVVCAGIEVADSRGESVEVGVGDPRYSLGGGEGSNWCG